MNICYNKKHKIKFFFYKFWRQNTFYLNLKPCYVDQSSEKAVRVLKLYYKRFWKRCAQKTFFLSYAKNGNFVKKVLTSKFFQPWNERRRRGWRRDTKMVIFFKTFLAGKKWLFCRKVWFKIEEEGRKEGGIVNSRTKIANQRIVEADVFVGEDVLPRHVYVCVFHTAITFFPGIYPWLSQQT